MDRRRPQRHRPLHDGPRRQPVQPLAPHQEEHEEGRRRQRRVERRAELLI